MSGYVKITFEDIEIAKNFFENDKHLDEFLVNVCKYYCGYENVFKYKNVKKFFETYKKTMDRVILGRSTGSIGGKKRIENQSVIQDTLEGGVEVVVEPPLVPKVRKERKLRKETKESNNEFIPPLLDEVIDYFKEKCYDEKIAIKAFGYYQNLNWIDSNGNQVKNWKNKMSNVWFKDEYKVKPESEKKEYIIYMDQVNFTPKKILAKDFEKAQSDVAGGGYILTEIKRVWE